MADSNTELFKPDLVTLEDLFSNNFEIPVYQRPYSWGLEQVKDLFDDILKNYNSNNGTYTGIYTGTIYLKFSEKKGKYDKYHVIDGQQRITTFTLLLLSIYWILLDRKYDANEKDFSDLKGTLWRYSREIKNNDKEQRVLELGNLDKDILIRIFNYGFSGNDFKKFYAGHVKSPVECENLLYDNLKYFYDELNSKYQTNDELLDFFNYIYSATQFIVIYVNFPERRVFEIFESINSKGKKLEEIDLIKSYIFQLLDDGDYQEYSKDWGELIKLTNDNLEDYLYVFIKAFVKFYKVSINVKYFKALCSSELKNYYKKASESEAVKALIKDMIQKVSFYNMMKSKSLLPDAFKKKDEFLFYYNSYNKLDYQHPKPLLFKAFCLFNENVLDYQSVKEIYKTALSFMLTFQTIFARDSKDAIPAFETIMKNDYENNELSLEDIKNVLVKKFNSENITSEVLKERLIQHKGYAQTDKSETIVLLAFYESMEGKKVNYNNASIIIESREKFGIDHILPQTPACDDEKFSYFKDESDNKFGRLVLKENSDFPNTVYPGMEYEDFQELILHKLGNLRIIQKGDNSSKGNKVAKIGDYGTFNTYKQINKRSSDIAEALYESQLLWIK